MDQAAENDPLTAFADGLGNSRYRSAVGQKRNCASTGRPL
jgi:hypothetical protein